MQGLRVSGGTLRGRKLRVDPGLQLRPTSDRARQAYFNIVAGRIPGSRFLDLYAGSGIFAFEAVSRGAREAVAVDVSRKHVAAILAAANEWGVPVSARVAKLPAGLPKQTDGESFDLVYADPPYDEADYPGLLDAVATSVPLAPDALVALEHRSGREAAIPRSSGPLHLRRTARYGNVSIAIFDLTEPNEHD